MAANYLRHKYTSTQVHKYTMSGPMIGAEVSLETYNLFMNVDGLEITC